jgi:NitT/TauT family transport system permease protein
MVLAYALSVAFALAYGISAALSKRAEQVLIPILDVLQSIPVLGYLPGVIVLFLSLFNGSIIGQELASVILIFTGMVWAVTFSVYGGVKTIPKDISEAAHCFGIRKTRYLRDVVFPAIYPPLISGSILAWGGGWYFLIACEYLSFANTVYTLPGLGFYIFKAALDGQIGASIFGLIVMIVIVGLINRFVWHPLMDHADKYKYEMSAPSYHRRPQSRLTRIVYDKLLRPSQRFTRIVEPLLELEQRYYLLLVRFRHQQFLPHAKMSASWHRYSRIGRISGTLIGIILVVVFIRILVPPEQEFIRELMFRREISLLPAYVVGSISRLAAGYFIALAWTLVAGILIARSDRLFNLLLPVFDIAQSVPALALFPIVVVVVIDYFHGSELGLQLASIILVLTGMQWYLFFNIIGAVKAIPSDVIEASRCFGLRGLRFIRHVVIPAIFPAIVLGSIQAWGGGWNATIASEYINTSTHTYHVAGLGYLLDIAVARGDTPLVIVSIGLMAGIVFLMNRTIWHYSLKRVSKFKFEA